MSCFYLQLICATRLSFRKIKMGLQGVLFIGYGFNYFNDDTDLGMEDGDLGL